MTIRFILPYLAMLLAMISAGCQDSRLSPISPTILDQPDSPAYNDLALNVRNNWSPYMNVHATGEAFDVYKDVLLQMAQKGVLRGIRTGTIPNESFNNYVVDMMRSIPGIDILFIIDNHYLFDANIEQVIDDAFRKYPEIRYFQIGNETTTILPKSGPTMTIEQYMAVLRRIYNHVQKNYPGRAILVSQSTLGSGTYGAKELERMVELGLTNISPDQLIIGINCYSPTAASQYPGIINGPLRQYRIWVTEAGIADYNLHASYISSEYQKLRDYLRPERIYWYVLWGSDHNPNAGFSLIRNPQNYPNYWKSELLKMLLEKQ